MPAAPAEMSCQDLVELLTEYLEDALDATTRGRLDVHLGRCTSCDAYLEQLRVTVRLLRSVRSVSFSLDSFERVLQTLLAENRRLARVTNDGPGRTAPTSRTT